MISKKIDLASLASVASLAWPFISTGLLFWTSTSMMQAFLAIFISMFIGVGFENVGFGSKSTTYALRVLGARMLLSGVHPIFFRLGPFSHLVLWLSRMFKALAAGCFLVGFGRAALQCKNQRADCTAPVRSGKAYVVPEVAPEELASRITPFDNIYDAVDAMSRVFRRGQAGVIMTDASTERSITVEFYWYRPGFANGVNIEFAASATMAEAMKFTLEDPTNYKRFFLERALFRDLLLFLHQHANETNEVSSGRRVYRGILP